MKKRLVSMMLVLCCLFSLVGCGGDTSESFETDTPPTNSSVQIDKGDDSAASETDKEEMPDKADEPMPTPEPEQPNDPQKTDPPATLPPENSTFSIHFIDVGQADAALVECDGHYMLIDGGNKADSNTIYSVLKSRRLSS